MSFIFTGLMDLTRFILLHKLLGYPGKWDSLVRIPLAALAKRSLVRIIDILLPRWKITTYIYN